MQELPPYGDWNIDIPTERPLRVVFMGTPAFAVPTLKALLESRHEVLSVFTQPDRKQGRGKKLKPPPVKEAALEAGLPVFQPEKLATKEWLLTFADQAPDVAVVVAYGKILRPRFLCVPPLGCINCHASLLPAYRGAAPIYWAIANGEPASGVSTMLMNAGMDTGPELMRRELAIAPNETAGSLHDRLSALSASLLIETLDQLQAEALTITPQPEEGITYAPMISKNDNWVDFDRPSIEVHNHIRANDPFPGARSQLGEDQTLKLFASQDAPDRQGQPGEILEWTDEAVYIGCQTGAVAIGELQLSGRKRMSVKQFIAGRSFPEGTILTRPQPSETPS